MTSFFPARLGQAVYGGSLYGVNEAWMPAAGVRWDLTAHLPGQAEPLFDLAGARGVKVVFRLREPSTLEWSMRGADPVLPEIVELGTDVLAWRNGVRLSRFRVAPSTDEVTEDDHTVGFQAFDYRGILNRRALFDQVVFTTEDQSDIAWALIEAAQAEDGGTLYLARGVGAVTGVDRDRTYEAGKSIGEALTQLASVIDGFDFDTGPDGTFDIYYPQRGVAREFVAHLGATVSRLGRQVDVDGFANAVRFNGADTTTPQERVAADIDTRREGRWDAQVGDPELTVQATVNERADAELATRDDIRPTYTVTLKPGTWNGPETLWLGDTCRLVARTGRLDVNTTVRVEEITVDVGDDGGETVQLTFDRAAPSLIRRLAGNQSRLTNLERR